MNAILTVALLVFAFGWLNRYVCCVAMLLHIQKKYGTLPSEEEMKACLTEAWLRTMHLK